MAGAGVSRRETRGGLQDGRGNVAIDVAVTRRLPGGEERSDNGSRSAVVAVCVHCGLAVDTVVGILQVTFGTGVGRNGEP